MEGTRSFKIHVKPLKHLRGLLYLCLLPIIIQPHMVFAWLAFWLTILASAMLVGWLNIRHLRASLEQPAAAFAWEPFPIALKLHNQSKLWAARDLLLSHSVPDGFRMRNFSYRPRLIPGETVSIVPLLKLPRRGKWDAYLFRFESTFPFNLFRWRLTLTIPTELLGLPRIGELRRPDDMLPQHTRMELDKPGGREGGEEFYALRAWRVGMSQRQVHWKASAKRGRLLVRENQAITRPQVHVVLHGAPAISARNEKRADFERAVNLAATLTEHLLRRHQPVRFSYLAGKHNLNLQPRPGRQGLHQVLTELALIHPDPTSPKSIPPELWKKNAMLIVTAAGISMPAGMNQVAKVFDVRKDDIADIFREASALPSISRLAAIEE